MDRHTLAPQGRSPPLQVTGRSSYNVSKVLGREALTEVPSPAPQTYFLQRHVSPFPLCERNSLSSFWNSLGADSVPSDFCSSSSWSRGTRSSFRTHSTRGSPLCPCTKLAFSGLRYSGLTLGQRRVNVYMLAIVIKEQKLFPCSDDLHCGTGDKFLAFGTSCGRRPNLFEHVCISSYSVIKSLLCDIIIFMKEKLNFRLI